ncbi:MAG: molybdate ABC transporter substrate-binding protein [Acidobacteriota bacterium]|nr:molybdate ABC transporter substrate-binding protein [Acidobacteriota bacterium]
MGSCSGRRDPPSAAKLTIAAAANLTDVFGEAGREFKTKTGVDVVFSYGSTAELTQQIENGAPFDLFAAADTEHVDSLVSAGKLTLDSRAVYALGQLALWIPDGERNGIRELQDLAKRPVHFIAVAQPQFAPYGQASIEALKNAALWEATQPKIIYANSIRMAKQMAATGNADVAFTAYSLVLHEKGSVVKVDSRLYRPIEQALAIAASSERVDDAKQFRAFLLGPEGRAILLRNGYLLPEIRRKQR